MMPNTNETSSTCEESGQEYLSKGSTESHERMHTRDKFHWCKICNAGYSQESDLLRHFRIHTGAKPFSCDVCGKDFTAKATVKSHMRIHTGEKPFQCKICDKAFCTSSNMKGHQRTHTGEKPFTCVYCGRGFSRKNALAGHFRTHTRKCPFLCHVCGRDMNTKIDLEIHMILHSSKEPYQPGVLKMMSGCAIETASKEILAQKKRKEVSGIAAASSTMISEFGRKTQSYPTERLAELGDLNYGHAIIERKMIIGDGIMYEEPQQPRREIKIVTASSLMKQSLQASLQAYISMELPGEEYFSDSGNGEI